MARRDGRRAYGPAARGLPVARLRRAVVLAGDARRLRLPVPGPPRPPGRARALLGDLRAAARAAGLRLGVADVADLALAGVLLDLGLGAV